VVRAVAAEFVKLFTTRVWAWLVGVVVLLAAGITGIAAVNVSTGDGPPAEVLLVLLIVLGPVAFVVSAVVGITALTGEFRHQTATSTFLAEPRRPVVVAAKLLVYLIFGALLGAVFVGVMLLVGFPIMHSRSITGDVGHPAYHLARIVVGAIGAIALFAPFGVGFGALVRNQPTAITISAVYLVAAENIMLAFRSGRAIYPYTPGGAAKSMIIPHDRIHEVFDVSGVHMLGGLGGTITLAVWALGLSILGSVVAVSRDVS